jgi:hypothetical protein
MIYCHFLDKDFACLYQVTADLAAVGVSAVGARQNAQKTFVGSSCAVQHV